MNVAEWWWNDSLQEVLKRKKDLWKRYEATEAVEDKKQQNLAKTSAKKAVYKAREEATKRLYEQIDDDRGKKLVYHVAKSRDRERDKFIVFNCVLVRIVTAAWL